jgi:hypothetical protein
MVIGELDATTLAKAADGQESSKAYKNYCTAHNFTAANKLQKSKINVNMIKLLVFHHCGFRKQQHLGLLAPQGRGESAAPHVPLLLKPFILKSTLLKPTLLKSHH